MVKKELPTDLEFVTTLADVFSREGHKLEAERIRRHTMWDIRTESLICAAMRRAWNKKITWPKRADYPENYQDYE